MLRREQQLVLLGRPLALAHVGVEVVQPPFAALLARAPRDVRRDERPPLRADLADELAQEFVFLGQPRSLHRVVPNDRVPPLLARVGRPLERPTRHGGDEVVRHRGPVLGPELEDTLAQNSVLFLRPRVARCHEVVRYGPVAAGAARALRRVPCLCGGWGGGMGPAARTRTGVSG